MSLGLLAGLGGCHRDQGELPAPTSAVALRLCLGSGALVLSPTGCAPLAAQLTRTDALAGRVRRVVHGQHGSASDVVQQLDDQGTAHRVPVLGLDPSHANTVDVQLVDAGGQVLADTSLTIQTGPLPPNLPTIAASEQGAPRWGPASRWSATAAPSAPRCRRWWIPTAIAAGCSTTAPAPSWPS